MRTCTLALVLLALTGSGAGCHDGGASPPATTRRIGGTWTGESAMGSYRVAWSSEPDPIPVGSVFRMQLRVEPIDAPEADDLRVEVDATMPDHRHGMTLRPQVTSADPRRFTVDGMMFHMPGRWEVAVDVARGDDIERATFLVDVE